MNKIIVFTLILIIFCSCQNEQEHLQKRISYASPQSPGFKKDTINLSDKNGLKQKHWIIKLENGAIEEGLYINNKREGIWTYSMPQLNMSALTYTFMYRNDTLLTLKKTHEQ